MMRSILYFAVGFLALSGVALFFQGNEQVTLQSENKSTFKKYVAWKNEHNKNTNGEEDAYRFEIFSENLKFITSENKKVKTLTLGLTQFADLTNSEFRAIYTTEITNPNMDYIQVLQTPNSMVSIDWVSKGAVTSVKNQGSCGSCWAFSTTAGLEGLEAIQTGDLVSLSDQQVTSCVPAPFSLGCGGGNPLFGYIYTSQQGIETNAAYPYVQENDAKTAACNYDSSKVEFQNKLVGQVPANSPSQMNAALQNQPLSVAVDAGSIWFQLYSTGILNSPNCGDALNHAITLVGYNQSTNAWKVKNSWGTGWGLAGYANIANTEGNGTCGMNMDLSYPTPTA